MIASAMVSPVAGSVERHKVVGDNAIIEKPLEKENNYYQDMCNQRGHNIQDNGIEFANYENVGSRTISLSDDRNMDEVILFISWPN